MRRFYGVVILLIFFGVCSAGFQSAQSAEPVKVRVLAYPFPPFFNEDLKSGITPEIVSLLNAAQVEFHFEIHPVAPQARYHNIMFGRQDLILFEMPQWEWQDKQEYVTFSKLLMKGGEVYIAKRREGRGQSYFDHVKDRHLGVYDGYHYAFANYISDKAWLEKHFKISFASRHRTILEWVRYSKVEVGVVTLSFLKGFFNRYPEEISPYLVSQKFAQIYRLKALARNNGPITIGRFEELLGRIKHQDEFRALLEKYGILRQWAF
ncbi:hypothetical protein [Terasakiella sp. SH-1]|uniref:hypothetical protein n=1 Tax=Terasakiella sp. SH-1 TaxID=2560057 RepID=UPI001072F048|nr:hypothetical protein [Terasakiella sp. SH-1]